MAQARNRTKYDGPSRLVGMGTRLGDLFGRLKGQSDSTLATEIDGEAVRVVRRR
jgi:hypothetical protein